MVVTKIKAIETHYEGHHFRSRIEARWAFFYTALGILYEYEKKRYYLGPELTYLPDFWLPAQEYWIEIKGVYPNCEELLKAELLSMETGYPVYIFYGGMPDLHSWPDPEDAGCLYRQWESSGNGGGILADECGRWCECPVCGFFGICYEGRADRLHGQCGHGDRELGKGHNYATPKLLEAYCAARSARFEG